MILGIGIDIVKIERMRNACHRRTPHFVEKIYTKREIEYCYSKKEPFSDLSARFAAKEALLKAFGIGWGRGISWTDMEIVEDGLGAPKLNFFGSLEEKAREMGIKEAMLSLSHTGDYAIAVVVLVG